MNTPKTPERKKSRARACAEPPVVARESAGAQWVGAMLDRVADAVIAVDPRGAVTHMNFAAERLTGLTVGEASAQPFGDVCKLIDAASRVTIESPCAGACTAGRQVELGEGVLLCPRAGDEVPVEGVAVPVRDELGGTLGAFVVVRDTGARRRAERSLADSERQYKLLFEEMVSGYALHEIICDDTGTPCDYRFLDVNPAFERITGLRREKIVGKTVRAVIPDVEHHWIDTYGAVALGGSPVHFEHYAKGLDKHFEVTAFSPRRGRFAVTVHEITGHKRAEHALREVAGRFESIIENTPLVAIRGFDQRGIVRHWNAACERLYGFTKAEAAGTRFQDLLISAAAGDEFKRELDQTWRTRAATEPAEWEIRTRAGKNVWIYSAMFPVLDGAAVAEVFCMDVDITAMKRLEEELRRSNEELEQFASLASHDLREPLRMVSSYVQLLAKRFKGVLGADADEFIKYAVEGANQMQTIVHDLMTYARIGAAGKKPRRVDCEKALQSALRMLARALDESGAEVTHDRLPVVKGYATQLGLLLQNLVLTAIRFRGDAPLRVHISAVEKGREWLFSLRDNGRGIPREFAERVFGIFQSSQETPAEGGATLGLSLCRKIVMRHGGQIWVSSEEGKGSTFCFTLPIEDTTEG